MTLFRKLAILRENNTQRQEQAFLHQRPYLSVVIS